MKWENFLLICREKDKGMEKEVTIFTSLMLFSGANTYKLYWKLKEKH